MAESNHGRTNLDTSSDASHTALLELKQELTKLGPEKAQRDLANAPCLGNPINEQLTLMHINGYIIDTELRLKEYGMLFAEDHANED